jgi:hypothetical protein
MRLSGFLWRYFRRHGGWALVAGIAILVFAAASAVLIALIEPIFSEVLLAGDQVPGGLGAALGDAPGGSGATPPLGISKAGLKRWIDEG